MKVLVAAEKPFAAAAVEGIKKEIEGAGNELVQKLFPDGNNGMSVNATRLVVRACELRIIDIDNLQPDEE